MKDFDDEVIFDPEEESRLIQLAKENLDTFFADKKFYCGGPIPKSILHSQDALDFVRYTEFDPGIRYCYEEIIPQIRAPKLRVFNGMEWDVEWVLRLLKECHAAEIPLVSQAGMILLNFRFCVGCLRVTRKDYLEWLEGAFIARAS